MNDAYRVDALLDPHWDYPQFENQFPVGIDTIMTSNKSCNDWGTVPGGDMTS